MKRLAVLLIALSLFAVSFTACDREDKKEKRTKRTYEDEEDDDDDWDDDDWDDDDDDDDPDPTTKKPGGSTDKVTIYDDSMVDVVQKFDTYYPDKFSVPWAEANNINFTSGNIETYYSQFIVDPYDHDSEVAGSKIKNNVATIYTPTVKVTDSIYEGYVDYEITYTEIFPMSATMPDGGSYSTSWCYHNIGFLDYYTGTKYPHINLTENIDSFHVYGDVVWKGETYSVSYYEFRSDEVTTNDYYSNGDGTYTWDLVSQINTTVVLTVPRGYDGMLMYVYVADDSDLGFDEFRENSDETFYDAAVFGKDPDAEEDEIPENYIFLSIYDLGEKYK
ncbi:MAG: hypothetical protein J6U23_10585 [Clostridiales bacterium]|nr:hypothetical protein [Clostridiales bacterium]